MDSQILIPERIRVHCGVWLDTYVMPSPMISEEIGR